MKKIYLIMFLVMFIVCNAQIVNIPDANFKSYLLSGNTTNNQIAFNTAGAMVIDANGNGEIEVSEAHAVTRLNLKNNTLITNISGIESFINVFKIDIYGLTNLQNFNLNSLPLLKFVYLTNLQQITSLNFNGSTLLNTLEISSCNAISNLTINSNTLQYLKLTYGGNYGQLDLTNCSILNDVYIEYTNVVNLNLSNLTSLNKLDVRSNSLLTGVNISGSNNLTLLNISGNGYLSTLDIANKSFLTTITCPFNPTLGTLNISNCPNLVSLSAHANNLSTLNLSGIPNLQSLIIGDNILTNINLGSLPYLTYLQCSQNDLTSLDVSLLPALKFLYCTGNNLTVLDLHNNPAMQSLYCDNNDLQYINLKNGSQNPISVNFNSSNPNLHYLCCDNEDINYYASNYYLSSNNVAINSYCSFTPGGIFYTVNGVTRYDSDTNGCDGNDSKKPFQKFNISGSSGTGSLIGNSLGTYSLPVQSGSHTITPVLENPSYFNIFPTSITASFPAQTSPLTQNFCLTANGNHNDLEIVIIPITAASPGFNAKYKIIYKNKGTTTQSGMIVYNFDNNLMNFLSSTVAPNSQATGVLNWNFTNLLPLETREITATFTLNTPTQAPPLNGGQVLNYNAQINGLADETPADNIFTLRQTVVNSLDPNDKTCLEGTAITQAKVGDYVHYLIRFENTGTANAQNIVVKDEIDISKYDVSSLVALNASHNFVTRITGNAVEFIFENIQLPFDNATNDGYVSFKIKTKSNLTLGESFSNSAKIYFDYNHPIITNTYTTTVQSVLGTSEISNDKAELTIYPNPVKDVLNIQSKKQIVKAEIYDINGRILVSTSLKGNSIHVSELSKGNYIIKVFTKDKATVHKFIKN
ncbi:T9SS C-terminal target domain-containing protein [Chryseobacterium piscium]|uniref:T9SS C-terminal target domain-containing protein n=1 Tax=Chryseobacterium piscium TaxID=333702 RepID=A0A3D9BKS6_9FLAO|nr:T9SS type A sorting domain-containing protein [Chryseobacterium piscium]REC53961.1 T9SS C-terminal target domain-containing protein [Chryseobacterium piscium]